MSQAGVGRVPQIYRLLLYPREPHGLAEPRHRVHYFKEILKWIDEHLRNL